MPVYSVISPESCAAIVWRDSGEAEKAAEALKLTSGDSPAFRPSLTRSSPSRPRARTPDYDAAAMALGDSLHRPPRILVGLTAEQLVEDRYEKFRFMGSFFEDGEQPRDPST